MLIEPLAPIGAIVKFLWDKLGEEATHGMFLSLNDIHLKEDMSVFDAIVAGARNGAKEESPPKRKKLERIVKKEPHCAIFKMFTL